MPPRRPEFFVQRDSLVDAPENWEGGECWHSGGNIWVREWTRELPDGRKIEVVYNDEPSGIGVNHYPDADQHGVDECVGGFVRDGPHAPDVHTGEAYAQTAVELMRVVNMVLDDH